MNLSASISEAGSYITFVVSVTTQNDILRLNVVLWETTRHSQLI